MNSKTDITSENSTNQQSAELNQGKTKATVCSTTICKHVWLKMVRTQISYIKKRANQWSRKRPPHCSIPTKLWMYRVLLG